MPKKEKYTYKVDHSKCDYDWVDMHHGLWMMTYKPRDTDIPVGMIWGKTFNNGKIFYVYGCYVPMWARRQGVMREMHNILIANYPTLMTGNGSDEGGKQFIKAFGYREHPIYGLSVTKVKKNATRTRTSTKKKAKRNS